MSFDIALKPINPIIRLADGTEYRFPILSKWRHSNPPVWRTRKLVIPYGTTKDTLVGFRLIVDATWSHMPNAEKKSPGGEWTLIPGYLALEDLHAAGHCDYSPWGGATFYPMKVDSTLEWEKLRANDHEQGVLSLESVHLLARQIDMQDGAV